MERDKETIIEMGDTLALTPRAALVVFSGGESVHMELRPILPDGSMGAARGVSRKFVREAFSCLGAETDESPHGFVAENILYTDKRPGTDIIAWHNPPGRRMRFFTKELGLEDGEYSVPGTIYVVSNGRLHAYCHGDAGRPTPGTRLLRGPFLNIYPDGRVCTGNARTTMPEGVPRTWENVTAFWEEVFWRTRDAHTIDGPAATRRNLLETIMEYRDKPFDTRELNGYGMTLGELIKKLR